MVNRSAIMAVYADESATLPPPETSPEKFSHRQIDCTYKAMDVFALNAEYVVPDCIIILPEQNTRHVSTNRTVKLNIRRSGKVIDGIFSCKKEAYASTVRRTIPRYFEGSVLYYIGSGTKGYVR